MYDLKVDLWDLIHPSQAVFLSLCTGTYTVQQLKYLISEVYRLSPEVSNELIDIYMKKSYTFLDLFTEPNPYESIRYDAKSFLSKSADSIEKYKYLPTPVPIAISINLSFKCNFRCRYCYQTLRHDNEKLDLNKCLMLIREAAEWGVAYVGLTGGEPTLFDGWMILLEEILSLRMNPVITTNGVVIGSRPDIADHLKSIGLKEITISLDASTPELHHYITRSNDTFSKVIDAISYLVNSGIIVLVKCVVTRDNMNDVENLIDLLVKLRVSEIGISYCEVGASGSEANKIPQLSLKELAMVREKVKEKNIQYSGVCKIYPPRDDSCTLDSNNWHSCGGLYNGMYIFPTGKVSICDKLREDTPFIYGDVFKNSLKEIRESDDFRKVFEQTEDVRIIDSECSECSKLKFCRTSCFVDSMQFKGNYFAKHPRCGGPFYTSKIMKGFDMVEDNVAKESESPSDVCKLVKFDINEDAMPEKKVLFTLEYHADITDTANQDFLDSDKLNIVINSNKSQDLHQMDSRRHFDNCCFKEGIEYIKEEWNNVETEPDHLSDSALVSFGHLLHTVQDFYAHSNWVEIYQSCNPIPVWDLNLKNLPPDIISGTWSVGIPKKCMGEGVPHSKLNKDKGNSDEGKKIVPIGPNKGKTLFSLAREAAICATLEQFEQLKQLTKQGKPLQD